MPKDEKLLQHRDESFYEWGPALDGLKQKLYNDEGNTFLVSAPFGWGKSSFTNILQNELENESNAEKVKWDINIIHTWKYELLDSGSVVSQLIFDLVNKYINKIELFKVNTERGVKVKKKNPLKEYGIVNFEIIKEHGKKVIDSYLKEKVGMTLTEIKEIHKTEPAKKLEKIGEELQKNYINSLRFYEEFLCSFLKEFELSPAHKNTRLIFIFRDCDRCNPENLLKIIDAIHHIDINNKIKFIIEADEATIKSILSKKYNLGDFFSLKHSADSNKIQLLNGYVNKIFNTIISIDIRKLSKSSILKYINKKTGNDFNDDSLITFHNIPEQFNQNYRFIKYQIEDVFINKLGKEIKDEQNQIIMINTLLHLHLLNQLFFNQLQSVSIPILALKGDARSMKNFITYEINNSIWTSGSKVYLDTDINSIITYSNSLLLNFNNQNISCIRFPDSFLPNVRMNYSDIINSFNDLIDKINFLWAKLNK